VFRAEKIQVVEGLHDALAKAPHLFLTNFSGLSANQANELRRAIRNAGGSYRVIKNRLAKRAAEGTGLAHLTERLTGPCAVAAHETDPVVLAKALADFAKKNPDLEVLAGVVDEQQVIDADGVKRLSELPGLPELQAQLLALINTPATMLARLISTPGTQLARVLDARREALGEGEND
jgi:large subunit ribosomal protein L10